MSGLLDSLSQTVAPDEAAQVLFSLVAMALTLHALQQAMRVRPLLDSLPPDPAIYYAVRIETVSCLGRLGLALVLLINGVAVSILPVGVASRNQPWGWIVWGAFVAGAIGIAAWSLLAKRWRDQIARIRREEKALLRERAGQANRRDVTADRREDTANRRDVQADARDLAADARDQEAAP